MAATGMFFLLQTVNWLLDYFIEMHQCGGRHKTQYKPIVNFNGEKTENSLFYATMASNVLSASDFLMIATACCISSCIDSIFVTNVTDLWLFSINQGYNFSVLENIFVMLHILCIATRNVLHLQFYFNLITEKYIYKQRLHEPWFMLDVWSKQNEAFFLKEKSRCHSWNVWIQLVKCVNDENISANQTEPHFKIWI